MINIFKFVTGFSVYLALARSMDEDKPCVEIIHNVQHDEFDKFAMSMYQKVEMNHPSPAATFIIRNEKFDADYFTWGGYSFVSERMREAMALDPSQVRFLELDDSQSAPLPRSKNFRMMELDTVENVSDLERTPYTMTQYGPDAPLVPYLCGPLAIRSDAAPEHDLFYDEYFDTELLCTEALALRVLKAGCTGIRFRYPEAEEMLYRTLRGVEKIDLGEDRDIYELVQAID